MATVEMVRIVRQGLIRQTRHKPHQRRVRLRDRPLRVDVLRRQRRRRELQSAVLLTQAAAHPPTIRDVRLVWVGFRLENCTYVNY